MKRSRENGLSGPSLEDRPAGYSNHSLGEVGGMSEPFDGVTSMSAAGAGAGAGEAREMPPPTAEYAQAYLQSVKDTFKDDKDKIMEFMQLLMEFKLRRIYGSQLVERLMELFKRNRELILGFNAFLTKEEEFTLSPEEEQHQQFRTKKSVKLDKAMDYVNKNFQTSQEKIRGITQDRPSPQGDKISTYGESNRGVGASSGDQERITSKMESNQIQRIEKEMHKEDHSKLRKREMASKEADGGKENDLHVSLDHKDMCVRLSGKLIPKKSQPGDGGEALHGHDTEKSEKPILEVQPSYSVRQGSCPNLLSTHLTELNRGVLNDSWVCRRPGSEEYGERPRNQHEEILSLCEDDRFELDMLVEQAASTAERVDKLVHFIQDPDFQQQIFALEEHLSAINLRCIERIYGDHGLKIIEALRQNPTRALPVVLLRVKQKHDEWSRYRVDMNKVWAEVYSKNHHKSLDHSLYLKQQDKM